jgi:hypothetical protein
MPGYNFRLNTMDGRFYPTAVDGNSLGDATVVVTDAPDINIAGQMLNRGAAVPIGDGSKWQVSYAALVQAITNSTRAILSAA